MSHTHQLLRSVPALLLIGLALAGCSSEKRFVQTPYVMRGDAGREIYEGLPAHRKTPEIPVFYVTDRETVRETERGPEYGFDRSRRVAYGVATVGLRPEPTWEELVDASVTGSRARSYTIGVRAVEELGEIAPIVERISAIDGHLGATEEAVRTLMDDARRMVDAMAEWMGPGDAREAVIFVHGFNTPFDVAVTRLAEAWHLAGRKGIPIVYTWPSGYKGLAPIAYSHDRESGEYTIVHLKMLLWALSMDDRIEKVHLVGHSRGTDVLTTALRELNGQLRTALGGGLWNMSGVLDVEARPDAPTAQEILKLEHVVLAAPDLDVSVFAQRFAGEQLADASRRFTVYVSKKDFAIAVADLLFASQRRLGRLRPEDIKEPGRTLLMGLPHIEIVDVDVTGVSSHSYMAEHPGALSDLILLLRENARPGVEGGRPLTRPDGLVWRLDEDYLKPEDAGPPESPWPYAGP